MISLDERERTEKVRSALEASQTSTPLLARPQTITRYYAPPPTTVFPLEYAFHLLGDVRGKTILEYGCGDGLNSVMLANRGAKVIAFDISAPLLALAKKRLEVNGCEGVDLLLASAHTLPLPDESIDVVFGMAILHHLDIDLASQEVRRVLKKGGRAIFEEPLRNSKLLARVRKFFPLREDVSPFERPLTDKELNEFAMPYRCQARAFHLLLSSVACRFTLWRESAVRLSARVDAFLLRLFPLLKYYATVKVFEMVKDDHS